MLRPYRALGLAVGRPRIPLSEALALAEDAERAGFGIIGAGEGFFDSFSLVGALTQRTRTAEVMTTVATWTRTPLTTALALATLADLSAGRYRAGFGAMPPEWSERWHGIDASRPVERMRDFVMAVRALLQAEPGRAVDHEGPFYRVRGYERLSAGPTRVPVYIGATGRRMSELAGEIADGIVFNAVHSLTWLRDIAWPAVRLGLGRGGLGRADLDAGLLVYCAIADDPAEAFDLARPALAFYFNVPYFGRLLRHHGWEGELERGRAALARNDPAAAARAVSDDMVEAMTITGTPADVRAKVGRYDGQVDWVMLTTPLGNPPQVTRELTARILSTFGAARPHVAAGSGGR